MNQNRPPRKYFTETALNIYSSEPAILAPADLDKLSEEPPEVKEKLKNSNIYLILKRPRITFVPATIKQKNKQVEGRVAVQTKDGQTTFEFKADLPDEVAAVTIGDYPFNKLNFRHTCGNNATVPASFLLRYFDIDMNDLDALDVAYVGQSYGGTGQRTAVERLSSHSTLQKILADIAAKEPHIEVLLALYKFEYHRFILNMDGKQQSAKPDAVDREHYHRVLESQFERRMSICLAEAALIRYFQPRYNKTYTQGFPKKSLKILKKVYALDFTALIVEASIEEHHMKLYSEKQSKPQSHHIAKFDLHDERERQSFFYSRP